MLKSLFALFLSSIYSFSSLAAADFERDKLELFKAVVQADRPLALGVVAIDTLTQVSEAIQSESDFAGGLESDSLKIRAFAGGFSWLPRGLFPLVSSDPFIRIEVSSTEKFYFPFKQEDTTTRTFYPLSGLPISVPMMHKKDSFRTLRQEGLMAVALPYINSGHRLILVSTDDNSSILSADTSILASFIDDLLAHGTYESASLYVPKIEIEDHSEIELKAHLSHIRKLKNDSLINEAKSISHKGSFRMDETGTVARAVVVVSLRGKNPVYNFDHPFLAIIIDEEDKALFINYCTFLASTNEKDDANPLSKKRKLKDTRPL